MRFRRRCSLGLGQLPLLIKPLLIKLLLDGLLLDERWRTDGARLCTSSVGFGALARQGAVRPRVARVRSVARCALLYQLGKLALREVSVRGGSLERASWQLRRWDTGSA